jgi:hypothetical protein
MIPGMRGTRVLGAQIGMQHADPQRDHVTILENPVPTATLGARDSAAAH